jgi:glucose/arabinose dehydrogenase
MLSQYLPNLFNARVIPVFVLVLVWTTITFAATLPTGFVENSMGGLSSPTAMQIAPDGRIFVCQQGGSLRVIKSGALLPTPFMTITVDPSGERGLLGIAFDPNFATNNFLYVYYTVTSTPRHNRVSRFTANGDVVVPGSEQIIWELNNLSGATNHNGGAIHFGPDGKLYIAVGENATPSHSQTLSNMLGKVLRINSDGTIPSDNPFFVTAVGNNRSIWALGLRNPFTFAFQPGTGRIFINDVGQSAWEEINDGIASSNYGWPNTEGATTNPSFRSPLLSYGHGTGPSTGCAIAGGAFYNPTTPQFPASFTGKYFYADLCSGWIRLFDPATGTSAPFASGIGSPVDLKVGSDGSLYYLSINSGAVFRVRYTPNAPAITQQPVNQTVAQGQTATFSCSGNGAATLGFQWQRNQSNIPGATSANFTTAPTVAGDNGAKFRCVVSNGAGSATSDEATLILGGPPPAIHTAEGTDMAIALTAVTMTREPFKLPEPFNFSDDDRTRVMLFVSNLDLLPNENASAVTVEALDALQNVHPLTVEFVDELDGVDFSQVIVRLPDNTPTNQTLFVRVKLRGLTSNLARLPMR